MGSDGFGDHISHLGSGVSPRLFERFGALVSQGISAEMMAEKRGFGRQELDDYARRSNELATSAMDSGLYAGEIMPMEVTTPEGKTRMVKYDEGPRRGSSLQSRRHRNNRELGADSRRRRRGPPDLGGEMLRTAPHTQGQVPGKRHHR